MDNKERLTVLVGHAESLVFNQLTCDNVEVRGGVMQMLLKQLKFPVCVPLDEAIKAAVAGNVDGIRARLVAELKRLLVGWREGVGHVLEVQGSGIVPAKQVPLWWHKAGKSQTASGYGRRLTTSQMVLVKGKWRRVYCCCYSNSGTCYIDGPRLANGKRGPWLVVND